MKLKIEKRLTWKWKNYRNAKIWKIWKIEKYRSGGEDGESLRTTYYPGEIPAPLAYPACLQSSAFCGCWPPCITTGLSFQFSIVSFCWCSITLNIFSCMVVIIFRTCCTMSVRKIISRGRQQWGNLKSGERRSHPRTPFWCPWLQCSMMSLGNGRHVQDLHFEVQMHCCHELLYCFVRQLIRIITNIQVLECFTTIHHHWRATQQLMLQKILYREKV